MTEQEISYQERILEKIEGIRKDVRENMEDVRKDVRGNFLKMLTIMLGAFALVFTGGGLAINTMLARSEANHKDIVELKIDQGKDKERDHFLEKLQSNLTSMYTTNRQIANLTRTIEKYECKKCPKSH